MGNTKENNWLIHQSQTTTLENNQKTIRQARLMQTSNGHVAKLENKWISPHTRAINDLSLIAAHYRVLFQVLQEMCVYTAIFKRQIIRKRLEFPCLSDMFMASINYTKTMYVDWT